MEVDDTYIGRLVGKAGSILADIMATTKASIKISQKGEFVAGTNDRIVTVTGTTRCLAVAIHCLWLCLNTAVRFGAHRLPSKCRHGHAANPGDRLLRCAAICDAALILRPPALLSTCTHVHVVATLPHHVTKLCVRS